MRPQVIGSEHGLLSIAGNPRLNLREPYIQSHTSNVHLHRFVVSTAGIELLRFNKKSKNEGDMNRRHIQVRVYSLYKGEECKVSNWSFIDKRLQTRSDAWFMLPMRDVGLPVWRSWRVKQGCMRLNGRYVQ
jgi:hypothetical protein